MEIKRFLVRILTLFFMLSTLITVAVALIGSAFGGGQRLGYIDLLTPVKYAALCTVPALVTWSRRELSPRETLLRRALMLVLIEGVMMVIVFTSPSIDKDNGAAILTIAGSVLVIFVLANLFMYLRESAEAKKMNRDLENFQQRHA